MRVKRWKAEGKGDVDDKTIITSPDDHNYR